MNMAMKNNWDVREHGIIEGDFPVFDYDWTLARPAGPYLFSRGIDDFRSMVSKLPKEFAIISNCPPNAVSWKIEQIEKFCKQYSPPNAAYVIILIKNKYFKKPAPYAMTELKRIVRMQHANELRNIFPNPISFTGDAAGLPGDFSNSDLMFARSAKIKFVPAGLRKCSPYGICFDVAGNIVRPIDKLEVVIMCGLPAAGKSTIAERIFGDNDNYCIIHGDDIRKNQIFEEINWCIENDISPVIDRTNATNEHRDELINFVSNYPQIEYSRLIHVSTPAEICIRVNERRINKVPKIAIFTCAKKFEVPENAIEILPAIL